MFRVTWTHRQVAEYRVPLSLNHARYRLRNLVSVEPRQWWVQKPQSYEIVDDDACPRLPRDLLREQPSVNFEPSVGVSPFLWSMESLHENRFNR